MKDVLLLGLLGISSAFGQQPRFKSADVHASTATFFAQSFGGVLREGRYINRDATMLNLIEAAYNVSEDNISGGPGWVNLDLFDVIATVPDGTSQPSANLMLQSLLADRFGLVVHNGTRPAPRYVLTVAKGGSKLKPASTSGTPGCQSVRQSGAPAPGDLASTPNVRVACRNLTAAGIAENLRGMAACYLDHDVIDSTKLEGSWDFDLEWTPRAVLAAKGSDGISFLRL